MLRACAWTRSWLFGRWRGATGLRDARAAPSLSGPCVGPIRGRPREGGAGTTRTMRRRGRSGPASASTRHLLRHLLGLCSAAWGWVGASCDAFLLGYVGGWVLAAMSVGKRYPARQKNTIQLLAPARCASTISDRDRSRSVRPALSNAASMPVFGPRHPN